MKDCAYGYAVGCVAVVAVIAALVPSRRRISGLAVWASGLTLPADLLNVVEAIVLRREPFVDLDNVHSTLLKSLPVCWTV